MNFMKTIVFSLMLLLSFGSFGRVAAQTKSAAETYDKIEMLFADGKKIREIGVLVRFKTDALEIESERGEILKTFGYGDIRSAEYSYTKNPRWKTGLGLGAASVVFFPLLLIAIPVGFSKHRRHWLTVRTEKDFAVLKLSKSTRKLFMPAFETRSSVKITALGDDK
jgi:hypothetical protein